MEKHTPPTAPAEEQSHEETIEKYVTQSVDFFCKTRSTGDLETLRRELPGLAVEYFHKLREACAPVTKPTNLSFLPTKSVSALTSTTMPMPSMTVA